MHLTGIIDAHEFRNLIIAAREALRQQQRGGVSAPSAVAPEGDAELAVLSRISTQLDEITALLRARG